MSAPAPTPGTPPAAAGAPSESGRYLPDRLGPGDPMIRVQQIVRRYGDLTAVDGVEFEVAAGEIFGVLGPNGAGKTTLVEMLECLQQPTAGTASVLGYDIGTDPAEIKQRIGVQLQASSYHQYLTLREILELFGSFYRRSVGPDELLRSVRLEDRAGSRIGQLSGGMRQRFSIVAALVNDPRLVFFDEPTSGLDPDARRDLWALVAEVRARGTTVVLTTHYMEEAQTLCDRVAIMDHGQIVALDTPAALIRSLHAPYRIRVTTDTALDTAALGAIEHVVDVEVTGPALAAADPIGAAADGVVTTIRAQHAPAATAAVFGAAQAAGATVRDLAVEPATLEDVYLHLTGRNLAAAMAAADGAVAP